MLLSNLKKNRVFNPFQVRRIISFVVPNPLNLRLYLEIKDERERRGKRKKKRKSVKGEIGSESDAI